MTIGICLYHRHDFDAGPTNSRTARKFAAIRDRETSTQER
jgi:hypothetical protein